MLAVMGGLEGAYCAAMVPFYASQDPDRALFWIRVISVFMPYMTWLVTELTVSIAELERQFMARFSRLTLILTVCFSATVLFEILSGQRLIFTHVDRMHGDIPDRIV